MNKPNIQMLSKLVYESKLRRMTNRKQPETMALTDLIDDLMYVCHNAINIATTSNEHIENIQIVFANYLASQDIDDETRIEKLKTQTWLIESILYFAKNYNSITEANDILCEFGEFIDKNKDI